MPNSLILTAKSSEEKETGGISNLSSSIAKGRDQGKPLENVSSKFFVGTEVGLGYIHVLSRLEKVHCGKEIQILFCTICWFKIFSSSMEVLSGSTHSPIWKCHFSLFLSFKIKNKTSCLLRSPSLTYGTRPKPNRSLSPLQRPCFPRECG